MKRTIKIRRSKERGFEDFGWTDNWMTFSFANYHDPDWMRFGPLRVIVENHIQPHEGFETHPHKNMEILTYVSSGVLTHEDSMGNRSNIRSGEMQRISAGTGIFHSEMNEHDEVEHNIQIWILPDKAGVKPSYQELRFDRKQRGGTLRMYVSPDGRDDSMSMNQDGFILQIEGGRVDHGAHGNDAAGMLYDQVAFDDAIKVALDFVDQRDDTLLIITTDHGNGNPALNAAGERYNDSAPYFDRLQNFRHSNSWILSELDANSTISEIRERVEYATQLGIDKEQAQSLQKALNGNLKTIYDIKSYPSSVLGSILANYTSVSFTSGGHTSDYVELAALGPGIDNLDHFTRNTELFDLMVNAADVNANMALA